MAYQCRYCWKEISVAATKCPWCHSDLSVKEMTPEEATKVWAGLLVCGAMLFTFMMGLFPISFVLLLVLLWILKDG